MKKKIVAVVIACMLALSFALVGCSSTDYKQDFLGTWEINSMNYQGETYSPDDLQAMKDMGLTCTLTFNDDGTCTLDLFGDTTDGTWDATASKKATITMDNSDTDVTIGDDGMLSMSSGSDEIKFEKQS